MTTLLEHGMIKPGLATTIQISGIGDIFVGMEAEFSYIPDDPWWLPKFGQLLNVADYPVLAAKLGTTYGGNGVTTFRMPDDRGRVSAGLDNMGGASANRLTGQPGGVNGDLIGATGGVETHVLTLAQIAKHAHAVAMQSAGAHAHTFPRDNQGGGLPLAADFGNGNSGSPGTTSTDGAHVHPITEAERGGDQAHNNVQPTIIKCKCILAYWPI